MFDEQNLFELQYFFFNQTIIISSPFTVKESEDEGSGDNIGSDVETNQESKTKRKTTKGKSKKKKGNPLLSQVEDKNEDVALETVTDAIIPEENNKKEEDVWASFLADVEEEKKEAVVKPNKGKSWAELLGKKKPKPAKPPTSLAGISY